jgi:TRAP transporter TAXI family solute receptor
MIAACLISTIAYLWINKAPEIVVLRVGTSPLGTDTDKLLCEVSAVLERHSDTVRLEAINTRDPSENIAKLNRGEIDLAAIRSDTPVVDSVQMVVNLYQDFFQLIGRKEAGLRTVRDFAASNIIIPPVGTDGFRAFFSIIDHYDIPTQSIKWKAYPFERARQLLINGQVDGIFTVRSVRDPALLKMFEDASLTKRYLNFIPIDETDAMALKRPFISKGILPKGAFSGSETVPSQDMETAVVTRVLVARDDVPADAIRELTKILFEHRLDLTVRFELATAITAPSRELGLTIPLHEGAAQFYDRDEPNFLQENAEPLALIVTVLTILLSGFFTLNGRLNSKQKNTADIFNQELLDISRQVSSAHNIEQLDLLSAQLDDILQTVVLALDTDEVTEDGFHSFSFLWDVCTRKIKEHKKAFLKQT